MQLSLAEVFRRDPGFWTASRRHIAEEAMKRLPRSRELNGDALECMLVDLSGDGRTRKTLERQSRIALGRLNELGIGRFALPSIEMPVPRPSILPARGKEHVLLPLLGPMRSFFWTEWLAQEGIEGALPLGCAMMLALDGGIGNPALAWLVRRLRWRDIRDEGMIYAPLVADAIKGTAHVPYGLPVSAHLLLRCLAARAWHDDDGFVVLPEIRGVEKRRVAVNGAIKRQYEEFAQCFRRDSGEKETPAWNVLVRLAATQLVLRHGIEPFIVSAASSVPGPVADPGDMSMVLEWTNRDLDADTPAPARRGKEPDEPPAWRAERCDHRLGSRPKTDWCARARLVIKRLLRRLDELTADTRGSFGRREVHEAAIACIDEMLVEATRLSEGKSSALHLALRWVRDRLSDDALRKHSSYGTIETHLGRVFTARLLRNEEAIDLGTWDPEEHELLIQESLEDDSLSANMRRNVAASFSVVYQFGRRIGLTPRVDIRLATMDVIAASSRFVLVTPREFDSLVRALLARDTREGDLLAAAAILGFYAGLRAAEVTQLTADDLVIADGDCYVEIAGGKSDSARRRVFLSCTAPPAYCAHLKKILGTRLGEFEADLERSKIPLFGPEGRTERYTRRSLIGNLIYVMKRIFGRKAVFHSLRHGFGSWVLARWYVLRYPDALDEVGRAGHWMFSEEGLEQIKGLFAEVPGQALDAERPDALTRLSKVLGQLGQGTYFKHYCHVFGIIHRHAVKRVDRMVGNLELPGKSIAALLPRAASRTTQARLPGKTIAALLEVVPPVGRRTR